MKNRTKNAALTILLIVLPIALAGCPDKNDNSYPVAQEEYLIGWMLHNIDNADPVTLSYSKNELAVYNYTYNYPADASRTYDNVQYWIAPFQNLAATSPIRLAVPMDRVYYVRGSDFNGDVYGHNWSFYTHMEIDDAKLKKGKFFPDTLYRENYQSIYTFQAVIPSPGIKEHAYFGTSPLIPASIVVRYNTIQASNKLLRGYQGKTFLTRYLSDRSTVYPTYKIYKNNEIIKEGNLTYYGAWDENQLFHYIDSPGSYRVEINLSSGYPVFDNVLVKSEFNKPENKDKDTLVLPILDNLEFQPKFKVNGLVTVKAKMQNSTSGRIRMFIRSNHAQNWQALNVNSLGMGYFKIIQPNVTSVDLKIEATTVDGTTSYEISPAFLQERSFFCEHNESMDKWGNTLIKGACLDAGKNPVPGLKTDFYFDGKYLGSAMTKDSGEYTFMNLEPLHDINVVVKPTGIYSLKVGRCGNSKLEPFEKCDTGNLNGNCPRLCSRDCMFNICSTCADTDGGINLARAGQVTFCNIFGGAKNCTVYRDSCENGNLVEQYCDNQIAKSTSRTCPRRCILRKCI